MVAEAISWSRTPWHDRARVKGAGVDCAQYPIAVFHAVGLIPDIRPVYDRQWALHNDRELYIEWILEMGAVEITRGTVQRGDLGVWKYGKAHSHGAIILDPPIVIHALNGVGVVMEDMDRKEELKTRSSRFFTFWGPK